MHFYLPDFYKPLQGVNLKLANKDCICYRKFWVPTRMRKSTSDSTESGLVCMRACVKALPGNRKWSSAHARKVSTKHSQ